MRLKKLDGTPPVMLGGGEVYLNHVESCALEAEDASQRQKRSNQRSSPLRSLACVARTLGELNRLLSSKTRGIPLSNQFECLSLRSPRSGERPLVRQRFAG